MKNPSSKPNISVLLEKLITEVVEDEILEQGRLRDIVTEPTKDLLSTFAFAGEKLSGLFQKLVKGLSLILPTVIIPGLEFQYDMFARDEAKRIDGIKKKYGDALGRNWEAIKDPDVFGFLMLAYPQTLLSFAALKKSPMAFLNTLEVITGGIPSVRSLRQSIEGSAAYTPRKRQNFDTSMSGGGGSGGGYSGGDAYGDYAGSGLYENTIPNQQAIINQISALLQTPEVQQAIAQSPVIKDMENQAIQLFLDPVRRVYSAKTLEDLKSFIPPQNIEKAKKAIVAQKDYAALPEQEKQKAMEQAVQEIKKVYKNHYAGWLTKLAQSQPQAQPEIMAAVSQIKNMK